MLATEGLEPPVACHPAGHATDRQARLVTAYHKAMGGEAVGVCVTCVCVGWVGKDDRSHWATHTGTGTGTGTTNTEAKLASPHATTATADHTLVRLVSCKYTHSLTHSRTRVAVLSACSVRVQLSSQYSLE